MFSEWVFLFSYPHLWRSGPVEISICNENVQKITKYLMHLQKCFSPMCIYIISSKNHKFRWLFFKNFDRNSGWKCSWLLYSYGILHEFWLEYWWGNFRGKHIRWFCNSLSNSIWILFGNEAAYFLFRILAGKIIFEEL